MGTLTANDGIVVYVKEGLKQESSIIYLGEVKGIKNIIHIKNKQICITSIYRSPAGDVNNFNRNLKDYLDRDNFDEHILIGDININLMENKKASEKYKYMTYSAGFISGINVPTRKTEVSSSCIDHIFIKTKKDINLIKSMVFESYITDHFPIMINIKEDNPTVKENYDIPVKINY